MSYEKDNELSNIAVNDITSRLFTSFTLSPNKYFPKGDINTMSSWIEVKYDRESAITNNLYVEYSIDGKLASLYHPQCESKWYYIRNDIRYWVFKTSRLKEHILIWDLELDYGKINHQDHSRYLVPIFYADSIAEQIGRVEDFNLRWLYNNK